MKEYSVEWKEAKGSWVQEHTNEQWGKFYKVHYIASGTEYSTGEHLTKKEANEALAQHREGKDMKTLLIRAIKVEGGWTLEANNGDMPTEGRTVSTRKQAYAECDAMYGNPAWRGRKVKGGYRIDVD